MVVWFLGQSLVLILLAFLLGIVVGRLTRRRDKKPPVSVSPTQAEKAMIAPVTAEIVAPPEPTRTPVEAERASSEKAQFAKPKPRPRKATTRTTENPAAAEIQVAAAAEQSGMAEEPVTTDLAVDADPVAGDELERIEGIGPKMADALRAAGIRTFTHLAESSDDTKRRAINAAGLTFAPSLTTWSRQAQLLADGNEEAFTELTLRLIAGRDTEAVR